MRADPFYARPFDATQFVLGSNAVVAGDLVDYPWVWIHNTQVATTLIQTISSTATSTLTTESGAEGTYSVTWSANTMLGGGVFR